MKAIEIYEYLDSVAPFAEQAPWDNSGILIGSPQAQSDRFVICLDCTHDVIDRAVELGAKIIVSHHPIIFKAIKKIEAHSPVYAAVENGLTVISCHTNFDMAKNGINDTLCSLLGLSDVHTVYAEGLPFMRCGERRFKNVASAAELVGEELMTHVQYYDCERPVNKICVCGGAGGEYAPEADKAGCDTFITGEAKHHEVLLAKQLGINLILAGHFATERVGMHTLYHTLSERFGSAAVLAQERNTLRLIEHH